jgi:CheY-like chemotaxis protein
VGLPDGDGYELVASLRAKYPVKGIAISGYGMAGDVRRSVEAGFEAHLTKPITMATLGAAISRVSEPRAHINRV